MRVKTALAAMIATVGFSGAQATISESSNIPSIITQSGTYTFKGTVADSTTSFADTFNFSINSVYNFDVKAEVQRIDGYDIKLWKGDNVVFDLSPTQNVGKWIDIANLDHGDYSLVVSGTTDGGRTGAGQYEGVLKLSFISAIPEPENYAMFLAGLGLLGVVAKRRRNT